jgi:hypothetical protein
MKGPKVVTLDIRVGGSSSPSNEAECRLAAQTVSQRLLQRCQNSFGRGKSGGGSSTRRSAEKWASEFVSLQENARVFMLREKCE